MAQATVTYASHHIANVVVSLEGLAQKAAAHRKKFLFSISQFQQFAEHFVSISTPAMLTMPQYESYKYIITESCQQYLELLQQYSMQCWAQTALESDISSVPTTLCNIVSTLREKTEILDPEGSTFFNAESPQWIQLHLLDLKGIYASFKQYISSSAPQNPTVVEYAKKRIDSINEYIAKNKDTNYGDIGLMAFSPIINYRNWRVKHDDLIEEKQIGSGASAVVYSGTFKPTGEKVAIKKLTCKKLDGLPLQQFQRELSIMATAQHECLLKFIGATETAPYCIITKWMQGSSLYNDLHSIHALDSTDLTIAAFDIARGMQYLHSQSIVHRDLKSLNVLIDENKRAKICDFGFSRVIKDDSLVTMQVGTPHWMAPEILKDKGGYDNKVDVYAYGIVLYEIVSKMVPYQGLNATQIVAQVLVNNLRPSLPKIPSGMEHLIKRCWDTDPSVRPTFAQIVRTFKSGNIYVEGADMSVVNAYIKKALEGELGDKTAETLTTMDSGSATLLDFIKMMETGCLDEDLDTCWGMLMRYKKNPLYVRGLVSFLNTSFALKASDELKTQNIDEETVQQIVNLIPTGHEQVDGNLVLAACKNGYVSKVAVRVVSPLHIKLVLEVVAQLGVSEEDIPAIQQIATNALSSTDSSMIVSALRCLISLKTINAVPFATIKKFMDSGNITLSTAAHVAAASMASQGVKIPDDVVKNLSKVCGTDPFAAAIIIAAAKSEESALILIDLILSGQRFSAEVSLKILAQATTHPSLARKVLEALNTLSLDEAKPEFRRAADTIKGAVMKQL